jgi:phosphohistidine phosphatase
MSGASVELYVLRHAHAGDPMRWSGDDARRPLSARGRVQAERVAAHLAALHLDPDVILSSPKVRARETAEPVARAFGMPVRTDERLGGGLTTQSLEQLLSDAGDPARALIVGHDPDFSDLVTDLAGAQSIPMRKGALARLDASRPLRPGCAILRWLIPPDALPGDHDAESGS